MQITSFRRCFLSTPALIHSLPIFFLSIYTVQALSTQLLPVYLLFSAIFLISTLFSLDTVLRFREGVVYYLLNLMFLLGFWLKYSVQKITSSDYREPIGTFLLNPESEARVLWVVICAVSAFLLSQLVSYCLFNKGEIGGHQGAEHPLRNKALAALFLSAVLLALVNLKFNIMLSGLRPDVLLPLKGNAVYYLVLTRGIFFLFFFYCLRKYSNSLVFLGAMIAAVCSVGVLSRMTVLTYFAVIFVLILQKISDWRSRETLTRFLAFLAIFGVFSYLSVLGSTGLRNWIYASKTLRPRIGAVQSSVNGVTAVGGSAQPGPARDIPAKHFDFSEKLKTYKDLALGRWVGMEGVMAVDSYPEKGFPLLVEALQEKSYHGSSFYSQISNPELLYPRAILAVNTTSVPGPVAFFYYSGNRLFVFFAVFFSTFILSCLEKLSLKFFSRAYAAPVFISTFMVFDFFQFGISPQAFARYWLFSFFLIAVFYWFSRGGELGDNDVGGRGRVLRKFKAPLPWHRTV